MSDRQAVSNEAGMRLRPVENPSDIAIITSARRQAERATIEALTKSAESPGTAVQGLRQSLAGCPSQPRTAYKPAPNQTPSP